MIYAYKHPDGSLSDFRDDALGTAPSGCQEVPIQLSFRAWQIMLAAGSRGAPWLYDAARQVPYQDPAQAAAHEAQEQADRQSATDLATERPALADLLQAALEALEKDEIQRKADYDDMAGALALAAVRPIVRRALDRERLQIRILERLLRLVAPLAGIPLPTEAALKPR